MDDAVTLSLDEATKLCIAAALGAGANAATARSVTEAAVAAEAEGLPNVGLAHFVDYLESFIAGRIDGQIAPEIIRAAPTMFSSNARGGAAHTGFDLTFEDLVQAADELGMAMFSQKNAYTCGALGYFTHRLAERGLVAFAATNGPALIAGSGGTKPVYCTNPLAFSAPVADASPLTIDQASSATAFVNVRAAAQAGEQIPAGWALDAGGRPTTDAAEAMKGCLLAFGGARGANIALMVEIMAAGVTGANWSLDAAPITSGDRNPGTGMLVIALRPDLISADFSRRLAAQIKRLSEDYGIHIPGHAKQMARQRSVDNGLHISRSLRDRIASFQ